jgi:hypothetical protein
VRSNHQKKVGGLGNIFDAEIDSIDWLGGRFDTHNF